MSTSSTRSPSLPNVCWRGRAYVTGESLIVMRIDHGTRCGMHHYSLLVNGAPIHESPTTNDNGDVIRAAFISWVEKEFGTAIKARATRSPAAPTS